MILSIVIVIILSDHSCELFIVNAISKYARTKIVVITLRNNEETAHMTIVRKGERVAVR